jgi:hypothetical protein
MTDQQKALSCRAVACKGWRWMPGMRTVHNPEYGVSGVPQTWVLPVSDGGLIDVGQHYQRRGQFPSALGQCVPGGGLGTRLPDLQDAATLGCLLALVRKAWRCPTVYVRQSTTRRVSDGVIAWEVCGPHLDAEACRALGVPREGSVGSWGHGSEAEALVAALESAP